jgi:hypothetical protein
VALPICTKPLVRRFWHFRAVMETSRGRIDVDHTARVNRAVGRGDLVEGLAAVAVEAADLLRRGARARRVIAAPEAQKAFTVLAILVRADASDARDHECVLRAPASPFSSLTAVVAETLGHVGCARQAASGKGGARGHVGCARQAASGEGGVRGHVGCARQAASGKGGVRGHVGCARQAASGEGGVRGHVGCARRRARVGVRGVREAGKRHRARVGYVGYARGKRRQARWGTWCARGKRRQARVGYVGVREASGVGRGWGTWWVSTNLTPSRTR